MAGNKAESKFGKVLVWLFSPMAIGIYIAIIFWKVDTEFYKIQAYAPDLAYQNIVKNSFFKKGLMALDQISIDARFAIRGPRPGDPRVAILAVDDRSLDIVGRWPWPRATLARALENTYKAGAKVIAADVVWSEKSDRPESRLVEKLRRETTLTPDLETRLQASLQETDNDRIMGEFISHHKDDFVAGSFFDTVGEVTSVGEMDVSDVCYDAIYASSPLAGVLKNQSKPVVVLPENEISFPKEFTEQYVAYLGAIEQAIREKAGEPKTDIEKYQTDDRVLKAKLDFCDNDFLSTQLDDNKEARDPVAMLLKEKWADIKSQVAGLTAPTFEDWLAIFQKDSQKNLVSNARKWTVNVPVIQEQGHNAGYFNADLDIDGTIRSTMLIARTGTNYMPSIALQAYLTATDNQTDIKVGSIAKLEGSRGVKQFGIANSDGDLQFKVPASAYGTMLINYAGEQHMFPHASIADMLDESKPTVTVTQRVLSKSGHWDEQTQEVAKTDFFKDKILVLGATAIGVFDLRNTPFDGNFPGVETHANAIDNLLRRDFLRHDEREEYYMPWLILAMGIILSIALARCGAFTGLAIAAILMTGIVYGDVHFLFGKGIIVSTAFPMIQVLTMYLALTFYKYLTEERAKKELRGTFSKYVSPAIVNEVLKDPKNLELGGRKERITVFFSDVRGFTTISEKLDPRALSDLLNSYLTPMTDLVFKNKGTLDKYMGDAIMAFFGAPISYPDHAKHACRCALQNLEKLAELQAEYRKKGLPSIDIGIGLNTGECSVGNMGSQTVRNYTVMGDAVNLASRLEGINKTYGTHIIISENTYADVKDDFVCREVDWVRVKGKLQPVKIHELLSEGKAKSNVIEMAKYFGEGYQHYHEKKFDHAIQLFQRAIGQNPQDETSKIYIERCQEFIEEPPPENWDGVYVMKTK